MLYTHIAKICVSFCKMLVARKKMHRKLKANLFGLFAKSEAKVALKTGISVLCVFEDSSSVDTGAPWWMIGGGEGAGGVPKSQGRRQSLLETVSGKLRSLRRGSGQIDEDQIAGWLTIKINSELDITGYERL